MPLATQQQKGASAPSEPLSAWPLNGSPTWAKACPNFKDESTIAVADDDFADTTAEIWE